MVNALHALTVITPNEAEQDDIRRAATTKHVTIVRPAIVASAGSWSFPVTPPLAIAYLASALLKNGTKVECVDAIGEKVEQITEFGMYVVQGLTIDEILERISPDTDCVGVTCMFSQDWLYIRNLLRAIRERFPSVLIVIGGEHASALPEFCLRDCPAVDICVLGEGEETFVDVVNRMDNRQLLSETDGIAFIDKDNDEKYVVTRPRARIRDVNNIPYPAWDLVPLEPYVEGRNGHGVFRGRTMGILATRGCPYKCTFCSNPTMYGKAYLARSPGDVLDEIEHYMARYQATNIDFYDLTMILKKSWILEFCQEIDRRGLNFTWQLPTGTRSEVIDSDVAPWLYKTGCRNITYAPESGDPETLDKIKKRVHIPDLMNSIRASLKAGINLKCNIVIGFPHETRLNIIRTIVFCWKLALAGVHDVGIYIFSPYPGSQLFRELQEDGSIPEKLDDEYFMSLVSFMDPTSTRAFCKHVSGKELAFWRFVGMSSFFGLSYLFRPWRFVQFVKNVWNYESNTVLEQRIGAIFDRFRITKKAAPAQKPASVEA